jgi:hydroxymethylpyrimidine pyrophosphatase-like HAD family hydrolase
VDDTVTWQGRLPEVAARALYRAHDAGLSLIAVTGRSAAWAELLLRLFPLSAAIAETGARCLYKLDGSEAGEKAGQVRALHAEPDERQRRVNDARRLAAADRARREVPAARLAFDNMGRVYDTAFDLVEDGPPISEDDAAKIRAILEDEGLTVAQSSVHINAWIGDFDKATMVARYFEDVAGSTLAAERDRAIYAGDSKNDGSMFAAIPLSVGVANVAPHLDWLAEREQAPRFVTAGSGGEGFAQLVDTVISARFSK